MPDSRRNKLTDRGIKKFLKEAKGKSAAKSDGAGLTLTVAASGYEAWVLRYQFNGKAREYTIGPRENWPLPEVRAEADRLRDYLTRGRDPSRATRAEIAIEEMPATDSFQELAVAWFERPEVVERVLKNWIYPRLGKLAPADIRPAHVLDCLARIVKEGAPTVSNDARRIIREVLDHAVLLDLIEINPAGRITAEIAGVPEPARTRHLSLAEIARLMRSMAKDRARFGRDNEITVHLLLMLGVRKGELVAARWSEIDFERNLWTIPGRRIKTRKIGKASDFSIPLPPQAVALLRELEVRAAGSEWVLPARRQGSRKLGHISTDTLNAALANLETGIEEAFTIHDLRRTMRSQLSAIGVSFAVAERCLNHRLPGQGEIYDRHDHLEQRRHALAEWAGVLDVLAADGVKAARERITTAQVIPLRRSA
jgi:integrase